MLDLDLVEKLILTILGIVKGKFVHNLGEKIVQYLPYKFWLTLGRIPEDLIDAVAGFDIVLQDPAKALFVFVIHFVV